jgi:hypothetical protein
MIRAAESTHWYTREGVPMYTVEAKNGNQRPTTLRDARALDLVPSVTTVLNVAAKPGLEAWKQRQLLLAALTLPRSEEEAEDNYLDRIIRDSREEGRAAADAGTEIHAAIQSFYEEKPHDFMSTFMHLTRRSLKTLVSSSGLLSGRFLMSLATVAKWTCTPPETRESLLTSRRKIFSIRTKLRRMTST